MCPQGTDERKNLSTMDSELINIILTSLKEYKPGIEVILPFWNGEPLVNKHFSEFVDKISQLKKEGTNLGSISIHTNATLLNNDLSKTIINSEIFSPITLSIDASTSSTYEKIRRGGDFNLLQNNIINFLNLRKKKNKLPHLIFQFIVMEENIHEVSDFVSWWQNELNKRNCLNEIIFDDTGINFDKDFIFIRKLMPDNESEESLTYVEELHEKAKNIILNPPIITETENYSENIIQETKEYIRRPCPGIFSHLGIKFDGNTSPCCRDFNAVINIGNIKNESIKNIWNGNKLKNYRISHIRGNFNEVPLCGECPGQPFGYISNEEIIEFLKSIGEEKYINEFLKRMKVIK